MANKKMTYASALEIAIATLNTVEGANPEVLDKLAALKASLDKKNAAPRTLTAQQKKNEALKGELVEFINENFEGDGFTVTDILKQCPAVEGDSNQHVSAILRKAVRGRLISKGSVKRRTYFAPVGVYPFTDEEEEA